MKIATVVFLRKVLSHTDKENNEICLAKKVDDVHTDTAKAKGTAGKLFGYGGKQKEGETIEQTAIRELKEEALVTGKEEDLIPLGYIDSFFEGNESNEANMRIYFYFLDKWEGEPKETETMILPEFIAIKNIEWSRLPEGDELFLPHMLREKMVVGEIRKVGAFYEFKSTKEIDIPAEPKFSLR